MGSAVAVYSRFGVAEVLVLASDESEMSADKKLATVKVNAKKVEPQTNQRLR
jgi:hypothetical protein